MAFTTMHFAVGMAGAGVATSAAALLLRRGWRWVPVVMTAGGIWACVPDMPRIFKEDFPNAPFASTLSARPLQQWLNTHGDWFFMHRMLDEQPREYALHGLAGILLFYSISSLLFALTHRRPSGSTPPVEVEANVEDEDEDEDDTEPTKEQGSIKRAA